MYTISKGEAMQFYSWVLWSNLMDAVGVRGIVNGKTVSAGEKREEREERQREREGKVGNWRKVLQREDRREKRLGESGSLGMQEKR